MAKNQKIKPVFIVVTTVLLVILGVVIGVVVSNNNNSNAGDIENETESDITQDKQVVVQTTETEQYDKLEGTETFVIFGVDSRTNQLGKGTRSDSIMLVFVDHNNKQVKVASVFRDCMVHIEGHGYEKITHAHSYGGPELALSTINENFDLDAAHYVTVNFNSVADLVDEIGGVEYYITEEEVSHMGSRITQAGTYNLTGEEAVTYSRIRYASGGDYKRSERQREMLFSIFEKAKTLPASDRVSLVEDMLDEINTNYQQEEIVEMLYYLSKYEITAMDAFPKVFYGGTVEGAWVEVPVTLVDMNSALHEFLYGKTDYVPSSTVEGYSAALRSKVSGANHDLNE